MAVVIPLYGQAQFVTEAVSSVLNQTEPNVTAVIVNDGCPDLDSHQVGSSLAAAHPEQVQYLRRRNGGLSAARNTGIRHSIARFPDLEAIFPLDSDNAIEPNCVATLMSRLEADPSLDWVAPHVRLFGDINRRWQLCDTFTRFRQLWENQADASALFRSAVFSSASYDESMKHGYEDWELYLSLLLADGRGATEPGAVLRYRSRVGSMLTDARSKHVEIRNHIRRKHFEFFLPRGRTTLEHDELPRFCIIDEFGETALVTDPEREPSGPGQFTSPPIVVLAFREAISQLRSVGLLRGLLFAASPSTGEDLVVLTSGDDGPFAIENRSRRGGRAAFGLVIPANLVRVATERPEVFASMLWSAREISVAHPAFTCQGAWNDFELRDRVAANAHLSAAQHPRVVSVPRNGHTSNHDFVTWIHRELARSTFLVADDRRLHIGFVVPWLRLGGVEHCVLQVSAMLAELDPNISIHLALTENGTLLSDPSSTVSTFTSITSVAGLDLKRRVELIERWGASMDVVVNAHSGVAFQALRHRAASDPLDHHSVEIAYLHVVDQTLGGVTTGWQAVAGQLEPLIDHYLVISQSMATTMRIDGVPKRKLVGGPNAPVVRPASVEDAVRLADAKARRLSAGGTLRVLIAGRLDHQKGGRRAEIAITELVEMGRDVHVDILGDVTLDAELPQFPPGTFSFLGSTSDAQKLSEHFAEADVLLMLSRWEGVPLAMLDAMAHGTVVLVTDVGGVPEVAIDGVNARLVPCPVGAEDSYVGHRAAEILCELMDDASGQGTLRRNAAETAMAMTWNTTARAILGMVRQERKTV